MEKFITIVKDGTGRPIDVIEGKALVRATQYPTASLPLHVEVYKVTYDCNPYTISK